MAAILAGSSSNFAMVPDYGMGLTHGPFGGLLQGKPSPYDLRTTLDFGEEIGQRHAPLRLDALPIFCRSRLHSSLVRVRMETP